MKQRRFAGAWMVGLAVALVVLLEAPGFAQTTPAGAYRILLEAPCSVIQFESVELMAVVRDKQGQPVNGVPVEFRVEPGWEKNITLSAQRPVTQKNGEASTMLRSDMTGMVHITAQVGDSGTTAHIAISGSGSSSKGCPPVTSSK